MYIVNYLLVSFMKKMLYNSHAYIHYGAQLLFINVKSSKHCAKELRNKKTKLPTIMKFEWHLGVHNGMHQQCVGTVCPTHVGTMFLHLIVKKYFTAV